MAAKKKVVAKKKKGPRKASGKKPATKKTAAVAAGADPKRVAAILAGLDAAYPDATCELNYQNAFQLLIATILSAQCTDVRVNQVTAELFRKYKKPEDFAYASPAELEKEIRPTFAAAGPDPQRRPEENRARPDAGNPAGRMDQILAPAHLARPPRVRRPQTQLRRLQSGIPLLLKRQNSMIYGTKLVVDHHDKMRIQ